MSHLSNRYNLTNNQNKKILSGFGSAPRKGSCLDRPSASEKVTRSGWKTAEGVLKFILFTLVGTVLGGLAAIYTVIPMIESWDLQNGLLKVSDGGGNVIVAVLNNGSYYSDVISSAYLDITDSKGKFFNVALDVRDSDQDIGAFQTKAVVLTIPQAAEAQAFYINPADTIKHCRVEVFTQGKTLNTNYQLDYGACSLQFQLLRRANYIH